MPPVRLAEGRFPGERFDAIHRLPGVSQQPRYLLFSQLQLLPALAALGAQAGQLRRAQIMR